MEMEAPMKRFAIAALALLALLASGSAAASGRVHFGFHFGVPLWGPYYAAPYYYAPAYYPPVYYAPTYLPPVVAPPSQPALTERPAQAEAPFWYYCPDSKSYYPYVRQCTSDWQHVPAVPPR
jgi:hypothetical protein